MQHFKTAVMKTVLPGARRVRKRSVHVIHVVYTKWIKLSDEDITPSWAWNEQIHPQAEGMTAHTHTQNSFIYNYRTKIPQDTCRMKYWNDPWYYVFLLSSGSSETNTKQELAPPCWLPHEANPAWKVEPCQPISPSLLPIFLSIMFSENTYSLYEL